MRAWIAGAMFWLALCLTLSASPALAHAQLLSTSPAANAVLEHAPEYVELSFNEPAGALAVSLVSPDGSKTDLLGGTTSGQTMVVHLPNSLAEGRYVLSWRIASADGHPLPGSLVFSVGHVTGADVVPTVDVDRAVAVPLWASKLLSYAALFVGIGGAAFAGITVIPARARRIAIAATGVGFAAAALSLGLQGLDALGLPITDITTRAAWAGGLATSFGLTVLSLTLAFVLAAISLGLPRSTFSSILAGLSWIIGALSLALSGHASAADPQWLTRPAVFLHIAGLLFWLGALIPLLILLRDRSADADAALMRFSRLIPLAVGPIVVSGVTLATIQLGLPGPNWFTAYSYILAGKVALLVVLFALAVWNRTGLTASALGGNQRARYHLRLSVRAEIVVVVVIIALVAGWRFTPPPRALVQVPVAPQIGLHVMDSRVMATLTLTPGQAGPMRMAIVLTDMSGETLDARGVAVTVSEPALGIEPFKYEAKLVGDVWRIDEGLTLPLAGTWTIEIDVRLDLFTLVNLAGEVEIP